MSEKIILEQENLPFEADEGLGGLFFTGLSMTEAVLEVEQTYQIEWDGQIYTCVASQMQFGATLGVGLGNPAILGLGDDTELKFLMGVDSEGNWLMVTVETASQHTVKIYQLVEDEELEDTDGIVLHNRLNQPVTYGSYNKLLINRASGAQTIFSKGEADAETVKDLNFKDGDIVVKPEKDKLFSKVTIKKPADLKPENIKKDVVIAGIKGTAEGNKPPVLNMDKTTLTFTTDSDLSVFFQGAVYTGEGITYIVKDAKYLVTFGGRTFVCKSIWVEGLNNGTAVIGNWGYYNDQDTGEPFVIMTGDEGQMVAVALGQTEATQIPVSIELLISSEIQLESKSLQFTRINFNGIEAFANVGNGLSCLIPNLPYTVVWDNDPPYTCRPIVSGENMIVMGNMKADRLADTGEPFLIAQTNGTVGIAALDDEEDAVHTVSITPDFNYQQTYAMEEKTLAFSKFDSGYIALNPGLDMVLPDVEYSVVWDGEPFTCTPVFIESGWMLGNVSALDSSLPNTGEPFIITNMLMGCVVVIAFTPEAQHTMAVTPVFGGGGGDKPTIITKIVNAGYSTTANPTLITADEFAQAGIDCTVSNFFAAIINVNYYSGSKNDNLLNVAVMANKAFIRSSSLTQYGVYVYSNVYSSSSHTLKVAGMSNVSLTNSGNTGVLYIENNALKLKASGYKTAGEYYVIAGYINS